MMNLVQKIYWVLENKIKQETTQKEVRVNDPTTVKTRLYVYKYIHTQNIHIYTEGRNKAQEETSKVRQAQLQRVSKNNEEIRM